MRRLFHDPDLQHQFDKDGFVKIDFLSVSEMATIKRLYTEVKKFERPETKSLPATFDCTFFFSDKNYRQRVYDLFSEFFQPRIDKLLVDYKFVIINIYDKPTGGTGEVPVHMDWSFVDETKYTSVSVWIPLQDVTRENGTLELVKGSQKLQKYRHSFIPYSFDKLWEKLRRKYLEPQNLKEGQILVFDSSLIHWSTNNDSDKVRTAWQLIMAPSEAPVYLCYKDPEANKDKLEIFEVDEEFYTDFHIHGIPGSSRSCGFVDYKVPIWTEKEMVEKIAVNNPGIWDYYTGKAKVKT